MLMRALRTISLFCLAFCAQGKAEELSGALTVFHAGSLSVPLKEISEIFKKRYPNVEIRLEAAGSVACARKLTELERRCDVLAVADYQVIDKLLIPQYAAWNIKFATNEMTIVYRETSRRAAEINADNWHEILMDSQIVFGRSNPNYDPCGYRAILTMKLAEKHYQKPGLAETLQAKDQSFIRPKETDLLALLESGSLDYIFLYRSVAQQHGLKYLILPDEVNLKNPAFASAYASVAVEVVGRNPGEKITQQGEVMVYGLTIPLVAENPSAALAFVKLVLSSEGLATFEKFGQSFIAPLICDNYAALPEELKHQLKIKN